MIKDKEKAMAICESFGDVTADQVRDLERKYLTQFIFYGKLEAKGQLRRCACTACRSEFYENVYKPEMELHHGEYTKCPVCGHICKAYKDWLGRKKLFEETRVMLFQAKDDALFIRILGIWHGFNFIDPVPDTRIPYIDYNEKWRFYLAKNQVQKYEKSYWKDSFQPIKNDNSIQIPINAIEGRNEVDKTFLRYFNVWEYFNDFNTYYPSSYYGLKYIITAAKHPNIEFIDKCGFTGLVSDLLKSNMKLIRWKSDNVKIMLGLDKTELHLCEWNAVRLRFHHTAINFNPRNKAAVRNILSELPDDKKVQFDRYLEHLIAILQKLPDATLRKIHAYAQGNVIRAGDWKDYLADLSNPNVKGDFSDTSMTFPKDLQKAKDRVRKLISFKRDEAINKKIKARIKSLRKFAFSDENYTIVFPECAYDLIREGSMLSHCVGSYTHKHAEGKTTILFVRKKDNTETPFYTMELDIRLKRIVQCRGYKNNNADNPKPESVKKFERKFLEHITRRKQEVKAS